jgi:PAS domain S-box-containing protein
MTAELRKTGISVVGDIPWGTHLCHFYETKQDLLDILLPYFQAGLEHNEFCMWITCGPLSAEEARHALRQAVPGADRHLAAGDIEIVPHTQWYLKDGAFNPQRVMHGWYTKLAQALTRGYVGMRANGNEAWLEHKDWKEFSEYEQALNASIANHPMLGLCTYPLATSGAAAILDVARAHEFAIAKRAGLWEIVETPVLKQTKEAIKQLNEELEQRVMARTSQLATAYEALQREIAERRRTEAALRERERKYRSLFESSHDVIVLLDATGNILEINRRGEHVTGYSQSALLHMNVLQRLVSPEDHAIVQGMLRDVVQGQVREYEVHWRTQTGSMVHLAGASIPRFAASGAFLSTLCTLRDITERKPAEEQLRATSEQLRVLSARLRSTREEEGARIARALHDELGSALTSLKWDLEEIDNTYTLARSQGSLLALRAKIATMTKQIDDTINTVRRIASELRPRILDDLGLAAAIEWQTQQFQARTGIICQVDALVENGGVSQEQATAIFRIFQEALTNILRHAQATRVNITIAEEEGAYIVDVRDNGRGITEEERTGSRSLGLLGIRERAQLIGGTIDLTGLPGKGTVLTVRVPLPSQAAAYRAAHASENEALLRKRHGPTAP